MPGLSPRTFSCFGVLATAATTIWPGPVRAEELAESSGETNAAPDAPVCSDGDAAVLVRFDGEWSEQARATVVAQLSVGLAPRNFRACQATTSDAGSVDRAEPARSGETVATVNLRRESERVTIEIDDRLTRKRVIRSVLLSEESAATEAYTVSVATEELLHATWAELELRSAPTANVERKPTAPAPPPPAASPPTPRLGKNGLDVHLMGVFEYYATGLAWGGPDLSLGWRFGHIRPEASVGYRRAVKQEAISGVVGADALTFDARVAIDFTHGGFVRVGPVLALNATHAWFNGEADAGDASSSASGWAVFLRGGAEAEFGASAVHAVVAATVGAPLLGLEVTDDGRVASGPAGVELGLRLGGALRW